MSLKKRVEGNSRKKNDKKWHRGKGWSQKSNVTHSKSFMTIFFVTQSSLICISWGSDDITAINDAKHPKGYLFLWDSDIITSKTL